MDIAEFTCKNTGGNDSLSSSLIVNSSRAISNLKYASRHCSIKVLIYLLILIQINKSPQAEMQYSPATPGKRKSFQEIKWIIRMGPKACSQKNCIDLHLNNLSGRVRK